ncbi:MAG: restriction modification system DNA specificity domain-containing protein, partial [Marinobacter sp. T13-3]
ARELITEHLDLWTGAVTKKSSSGRGSNGKVELTGVKKLRELILELAVRGKLVDQYPNSNPAQGLLEQCREAKQTAIDQGKLKKARKHAPIDSPDMPFNLPNSWSWARLDDLVRVINGRAYKKHEMLTEGAKATPLLRVGNLFTSNDWYYSDLELEEDKYIDSGDLIYAWSASFGPFIWNGGRAIYHYHIWKLDFFDEAAIDKRFLYFYLQAVTEEIKSSGSGIAMIHMTKAKMEELVTPVPPLEEQHRIVQKVDELMALCDRLEQQTSDQLEAHETLVDTLLGTLTQSENATELADNWARLAAHFGTLFTTEQSIDKLKQTILQLAVMGRLVEQDAGDESAESLLNRLTENRQAWLQEQSSSNPECKTMLRKLGKLRPAQSPFPMPKGWCPAHLIQLCRMLVDCHNKTAPYAEEGIPIIRTSNIRERRFNFKEMKYVDEDTYTYWSRRCPPEPEDIIFTREAPMGEAAIIPEGKTWCLGQRTMLIRPMHEYISNQFLLLTLTEPHLLERAAEKAIGSTVKHLRVGDVENLVVPVPPIEEQHRIVQKVDELMALCNQLKEHLSQAGETRCQLAETIVQQALS